MQSWRCLSTSTAKISTIVWFHFIFIIVAGSDYYCDDGKTTNIQLGSNNNTSKIYTLLEGEQFYGDNRLCTWVIDSGSDAKRIQLQVLSTDLQWAPESAICTGGYDYVLIRDGESSDSSTIVLWCGSRNPGSVTSTGRYLTVIFQSNPRNQFKYSYTGVSMVLHTFDVGSCPPEWTSPMTSDPYCYKVMSHPEMWTSAQLFCNYNQANLAVISTRQQQNYVKQIGSAQNSESTGWIGLSKIASESEFKWLNGSGMTTQYFVTRDYLQDEDCVYIKFDTGDWQAAHCTRLLSPFVCQTNKRGITAIYKLPVGTREIESQSNVAVILAGVLGSLVVVGGIIAAVIIYRKCFAKKKQNRKQDYSAAYRHSQRQESNDRAARTPVPLAPSAPANDDVMGTQMMFLNSRGAEPGSFIPPPSYDEAVRQPGPVDL